MIDMNEFVEKYFSGFDTKEKSKVVKCLKKGTSWQCEVPECQYKWVSKPGEVFEKCPECGSNKISFECNNIWYCPYAKNKEDLWDI